MELGKILLAVISLTFASPSLAGNGEAVLCGNPPLLDDADLKHGIEAQAAALAGLQIEQGDQAFKSEYSQVRKVALLEHTDARAILTDYYFYYQICLVIMLDDGMTIDEKIEHLVQVRQTVDDVGKEQKVAGLCRHRDFGIEKWEMTEAFSGTSQWQDPAQTQPWWCNRFTEQIFESHQVGPVHEIQVVDSSEESDRYGFMNRENRYRYHCTIEVKWQPVYNARRDADHCGYL